MAKNDTKVTDNPKLKEKTLSDGQISLYLEYYLGYSKQYDEEKDKEVVKIIRKKEFLNLYIWQEMCIRDSPKKMHMVKKRNL